MKIPRTRDVATIAATAATVAVAVLLGSSAGWAKDVTIRMAVPDHAPTRIMQDLANERYRAPSENNVRLDIDFIPWPNYYERLAASLASGEQKYQMVISDSQWLGAFVEGGYYMKINEFIDADPELQAIFDDVHPSLIAAYSSYPYGSENYYGFPENAELLIVFYRRDLFCNTDEQTDFEARYGYELPCTPEEMNDVDWDMVRNFGEFFRRTKGEQLAGQTLDDDFYGIAYEAAKSYDSAIMPINAFIWQHGGSIWDETNAPKGQAEGVVNSHTAVKAFEHYLSLLEYMPPVVKTGTMDVMKVHELFREGKVAWIIA
jgi:multiple sugar transport system substrate-binding protein